MLPESYLVLEEQDPLKKLRGLFCFDIYLITSAMILKISKFGGLVHHHYDFFYDLTAALLKDVFGIRNQALSPSWNLGLLTKTLCSRIMRTGVAASDKEASRVVHIVGAMRILKAMLSRENELGNFGVRNECPQDLMTHLLERYVFSQSFWLTARLFRMALALIKVLSV